MITTRSNVVKARKSVGSGEWGGKCRTGNFSTPIVFTICTNQFLKKKNYKRAQKPETDIKDAF